MIGESYDKERFGDDTHKYSLLGFANGSSVETCFNE